MRCVPRGDKACVLPGDEPPEAERDGDGGDGVSGCRSATGIDRTAEKTARRKKLFLTAFERNACDVTAACKATAINRGQVYAWRKADKEFEVAFIEATEQDLDFTESQLKKNIKSGKLQNTMLLAKGSLFLGRLTQLSDGISLLLERNRGGNR